MPGGEVVVVLTSVKRGEVVRVVTQQETVNILGQAEHTTCSKQKPAIKITFRFLYQA